MTRLTDLQLQIQQVSEAVARAERTSARASQYPSAGVTLQSLEKLRENLIIKFQGEASQLGVNACSYRIEYDEYTRPAIHGVTSAIGIFQDLFTTVYHSLRNGARKRSKPSQQSLDATRLDFAFTFAGSVGFMMTMRDDTDLLKDSAVDQAMSTTLALISAPDTNRLDELTEVTGLPAVRLAQQWASENAKYRFGADIKWKVESDAIRETRVQLAEVIRLSGMLGQYIAKEKVTALATLQHVNMFDKTFEMTVEHNKIVGTFERAISADRPASLPRLYLAYMTIATRVAPSDGSDGVTYFLDRLEEFDPAQPKLPGQDSI